MTASSFWPAPRRIEIVQFENPVSYSQGLSLQKELHREVAGSEISDQLILLEHLPVYTLGKRGSDDDFLIPREQLLEQGAEIVQIDRGGQITYHGPGQIVLYILSNLADRARSIRKFIFLLEQSVIDYLDQRFGISAERNSEHPGVWVGDEKIAALGISVHQRTTMHGLALNLTTDLSAYDAIVPCGIRDKGVCSVQSIRRTQLGYQMAGEEVATEQGLDLAVEMTELARIFCSCYGYEFRNPEFIH